MIFSIDKIPIFLKLRNCGAVLVSGAPVFWSRSEFSPDYSQTMTSDWRQPPMTRPVKDGSQAWNLIHLNIRSYIPKWLHINQILHLYLVTSLTIVMDHEQHAINIKS